MTIEEQKGKLPTISALAELKPNGRCHARVGLYGNTTELLALMYSLLDSFADETEIDFYEMLSKFVLVHIRMQDCTDIKRTSIDLDEFMRQMRMYSSGADNQDDKR